MASRAERMQWHRRWLLDGFDDTWLRGSRHTILGESSQKSWIDQLIGDKMCAPREVGVGVETYH
jgi:hypothetical protein